MAHSIEELIQAKLEDLVGDTHDLVSKAQIVAEAEALFIKACTRANVRTAAAAGERDEDRQVREAALMDALLQATGRLSDWDAQDEDDFSYGAINGVGLSIEQILHRAAQTAPARFAPSRRQKAAEIARAKKAAAATRRTTSSSSTGSSKGFGLGDMDIINEEDMEIFKPLEDGEGEKEGAEALNFDLIDGHDSHDPSIFRAEGTPMHRSTWRSR